MKKLISILTPLILIFSLFCGCKNAADESTASSVSDTLSKAERSAESSAESSSVSSEATEESTGNTKLDKMLSELNEFKPHSSDDDTFEIFEIINNYAEYLSGLSGPLCNHYSIDDIEFTAEDKIYGVMLYDFEGENIDIDYLFYPTTPTDPYNEASDYDSEVKELVNKVKDIKADSTREEVIKILGEPDTSWTDKLQHDTYDYDKYDITVVYYYDGLFLNINEKGIEDSSININTINVVYPE